MFRYKIIQLQGETNIGSDMTSYGEMNNDSNLTESSHLLIEFGVQQIVKISLYSDVILDGFIENNIEKEIKVNGKPIPLFVKVRY